MAIVQLIHFLFIKQSKRIFCIILISFNIIPNSFALVDREVAESLKCSRMFSYFERKLLIPLDTLHSIALKESGKSHSKHKIRIVWPWTVNVEGKGYFFDSKLDAISFVKRQIFEGKTSIDIGCMQINLKHHPEAFLSLEHAFDPRKNIAYGATFLKSKYEQLGCWHKAIAHYHSATHDLGFKYKEDVVKIASNMDSYKNSLRNYIKFNSHINSYAYNGNKVKVNHNLHKQHVNRITEFQFKKRYKSNMMVHVPQNVNTKSR